MVGKNLSHYKILEELGHGDMEVVFMAQEKTNDNSILSNTLGCDFAHNHNEILQGFWSVVAP